MKKKPLSWTADDDHKRLDAFVASHGEIKSRTLAQKLIDDGHVKINGKVIRKSAAQVLTGDKVGVTLPVTVNRELGDVKADIELPILYEDTSCLVFYKPAGFAVHPGHSMEPSEATILHALQSLFKRKKLPFSLSEVLVHRLDKETTGCLLVAKTPKAHMALQKQFKDRTIGKTYLALVAGVPEESRAMIDAPIGRHPTERTRMAVHRTATSRDARTSYEVLSRTHDVALLSCDLHTGRTHQIRVHLTSIGHGLLGDDKYLTPRSRHLTSTLGIDSLCLHAWKLSFVSPATGKKVQAIAPPPEGLRELIETLGLKFVD